MSNQYEAVEEMDWQKLPKVYFPSLTDEPFQTREEEREHYLRFLDLLLVLSVYQSEKAPAEAADRVGVLFPDAELMRSLEPAHTVPFSGKKEVREIFKTLLKKGSNFPLSKIFLSDLLSPMEILAFLLAYSVAASRKYEKIYAVLSQQPGDTVRPTIGLCVDFSRFFLMGNEIEAAILFDPDSFLNKVLLVKNESILLGELARPLILRDEVLLFVNDVSDSLGSISRCGSFLFSDSDSFTCHPDKEEELYRLYLSSLVSEEHRVIELCGEAGCGKKFLLGKLGGASEQGVLAIDVQKLLSFSASFRDKLLADVCVKVLLEDHLIYLYGIEEEQGGENEILYLFSFLQDYLPLIFIGTEKPISGQMSDKIKGSSLRIDIPQAEASAQKQLWIQACENADAVFADDVNLDELVSKYTMNPGRIFAAMEGAVSLPAEFENNEENQEEQVIRIDKRTLQENIRRICAVQFGDNAKRIESPFVWDDLILDEKSKKLLRLACDRVCYRSHVYEDYGFGKKLPYGRGVAIVFYGPPGTGKTMAAQVLANELGLDIYRIDLSRISSKYIGETEKNLGTVFDVAKNSNAILFFDEADSLFSKRTQVSSSNDKHANAETSYLLQKIEEYTGVSILATNNLQNFDVAFKRRMTYLIPIGMPDEATRTKMWEAAFPESAPLARNIDFTILGRAVEITGSNIKNAAVAAAYLAAAQDREITMEDIVEAVDLECLKVGKMSVRSDIQAAIAGRNK